MQPYIELRWLHLVLLAWGALLLWRLPVRRGGLWLLGLAGAVRWLTWEPRMHMHGDKGYNTFMTAWGASVDRVYGDAWPNFGSLGTMVHGPSAYSLHVYTAVLSALTVPWLFSAVLRATGDVRAARAAGVLLAVLPIPVTMSGTESPLVFAAMLQAVAVAALLSDRRVDHALGGLSLILLASTRPMQMIMAGAIWLAWAWKRPKSALLWVTAAALGWRALEFIEVVQEYGKPTGDMLDQLPGILSSLHLQVGPGARWGVTDPQFLPAGVLFLGLLGLVFRTRAAAPFLALWFLGAFLYLGQGIRADQIRFHLPQTTWWAALAGLGFAALPAWSGLRGAVAGLVTLSFLTALQPRQRNTPWMVEHRFLLDVVSLPDPGAEVHYFRTVDSGVKIHRWLRVASPATWEPIDAERAAPDPSAWYFIGTHDASTPPPSPGNRPLVAEHRFYGDWLGMPGASPGMQHLRLYGPEREPTP